VSHVPLTTGDLTPAERAYDYLLAYVEQAAEGRRLPSERAVANELGISRQSARAAFHHLEENGCIERIVGSGSFVRHAGGAAMADRNLPDVGILDVLEVRHILEPMIAALATSRATGDDFVRIRAKLTVLQKATEPQDYKAAGYAFWQEIAQATRNPLLAAMYRMLIDCRTHLGWDQLKGMTIDAAKRAAQLRLAEEIYEALKARAHGRARSLAAERTRNMLLAVIDLDAEIARPRWSPLGVDDHG
jgi:DNA-binding FadR family transcriptional regulator